MADHTEPAPPPQTADPTALPEAWTGPPGDQEPVEQGIDPEATITEEDQP